MWSQLCAVATALAPLCALFPLQLTSRDLPDLRNKLRDRVRGSEDYFKGQTRQVVVQHLADIATEEAWELVLYALTDPNARVADEAQIALGRVRDAEGIALVCGREGLRSREGDVALRAAEALGRVGVPVEAKPLVKALGKGESEVRRSAIWSLERLARAGLLTGDLEPARSALRKCARSARDGEQAAAALRALSALGDEGVVELAESSLSSREPIVVAGAAAVLTEWLDTGALEHLRSLLGHESRVVRAQVARSLRRIADRGALEVLIDGMVAEPRPRLKQDFVGCLQSLTGMRYRDDPRSWRHYLGRIDTSWRGGQAPTELRLPKSAAQFVGLSMISDRVVFLIDFSGSMWDRRAGASRRELVERELEGALTALPRTARFNVIPFADEPEPWEDALQPARPGRIKDAMKAFRKCRANGRGNFYDAARLAMEDPEVDTLVVLTDGAPTGGRRWNMDLMTELLEEWNRFRFVTVDAILIRPSPRVVAGWRELTRRMNGRCLSVDLEIPPE